MKHSSENSLLREEDSRARLNIARPDEERHHLRRRLLWSYIAHSKFREALRTLAASEEDVSLFCSRWGLQFDDGVAERGIEAWRVSRRNFDASCVDLIDFFYFGPLRPRTKQRIMLPIFWSPAEETLGNAMARLEKQASELIRNALDEILLAHDRQKGISRPKRQALNIQLKWLFARQCHGWSYPHIAQKLSAIGADNNVRMKCKQLADRMGLRLK